MFRCMLGVEFSLVDVTLTLNRESNAWDIIKVIILLYFIAFYYFIAVDAICEELQIYDHFVCSGIASAFAVSSITFYEVYYLVVLLRQPSLEHDMPLDACFVTFCVGDQEAVLNHNS